jgi:16S rRNA processing protein RimM
MRLATDSGSESFAVLVSHRDLREVVETPGAMPANMKSSKDANRVEPQNQSYYHRNRRVIVPDGVMAVGLIVGAHGLRGEVRVESHTDFPERFAAGNTLLMGLALTEIEIETSRPHKAFHLLQFSGVTNRTEAENLRGQWLFISNEDAAPLAIDTYWIHDIVGMAVKDAEGRLLGTVRQIIETGANDVYIVDPAAGVNQGREILLPAIADVVQAVNLEERVILVELMPGLLDEDEGID